MFRTLQRVPLRSMYSLNQASGAIQIKIEKNVLHFVLSNPSKLNRLSTELINTLEATTNKLNFDTKIRALAIYSSSPKAFSTGADLIERMGMTLEETNVLVSKVRRVFSNITKIPIPTFSLIDGYCLGGGLELAISTDFRIATRKAILGLPETSRGIIPGAGGCQRLSRLVGLGPAKRMILLNQQVTGEEAFKFGLVDYVAEDYAGMFEVLERLRASLDETVW